MSDRIAQQGFSIDIDTGAIKIRLGKSVRDVSAKLCSAMGISWPHPLLHGQIIRADDVAAMALGPEEWMIVGAIGTVETLLPKLESVFRDDVALILDMSHGVLIWRLSGLHTTERIAAYCDLDLHPAHFPDESAARTRFGDILVTLLRLSNSQFWLISDQSHANYLMRLLEHAAPVS